MITISFISLVFAFIYSDFSNETVFNNSHTLKPLFYKISGSWGNHEGSLLLWLLVLSVFLFIFLLKSGSQNIKYRVLTLFFQQIIIAGFLIFILLTSNPFNMIFPIPSEGLGLNPILQDPALAIHPPILYLGYVGTSIIFSASLASLITGNIGEAWAKHIKKWVLVSWIFLTIGILLGSIWAYYELGWGGFWFWDPVENVSLMPWFCLTALLHTVVVLEKRNLFKEWTIILSITTFSLSMSGTFLVRSGILNSIHTFANDPSRGLFILSFLFILILMALTIFFFNQNKSKGAIKESFILSKETAILVNNWFMMFFLSVVLVGTIYPIFLEVLNGSKISVGPPFYHNLLIPFLIPFLVFMSFGPSLKWIKDNVRKFEFDLFVIFLISILISYFILIKSEKSFLLSIPLIILSFYLLIITIKDFFSKKSYLSQKVSHFGFSLLILSILLNSLFSFEFNSNMKVGDQRVFKDKIIILKDVIVQDINNYKSLKANFEIKNKNTTIPLTPEVRIYQQPFTITSEAAIKTTLLSDNFLVFNILKDDGYYNIRYQYKPLMIWIWISTILISIGGVLSILRRNEKKY
tara:strand:- start:1033 stop:2769 length:1737 start_codon:yes stop_codon:yes gene_type:complete